MAYDKILVITDALHIHSILKNVINNNTSVHIKLKNSDHLAATQIIGISFDEQYLLLDELIAGTEIEKIIETGNKITLSGVNNAVKFRFHTDFIEAGENNHIPYYRLKYPTELEYAQRRQLFRLELAEDWRFPVKIINKKTTHEAYAKNISLGGLNIKCEKPLNDYACRDNLKLLLSFPDTEPVPCTAHICNIHTQNNNSSNLACKFIELDDQKAKLIQSYIFKVQRESRHRGTATSPV